MNKKVPNSATSVTIPDTMRESLDYLLLTGEYGSSHSDVIVAILSRTIAMLEMEADEYLKNKDKRKKRLVTDE